MTFFQTKLRQPEETLPIAEYGLKSHARRCWSDKLAWTWEQAVKATAAAVGTPDFVAHVYHMRSAARTPGYRPADHLLTKQEAAQPNWQTRAEKFTALVDALYAERGDDAACTALLERIRRSLGAMRIHHAKDCSVAV